MNRAILTLMTCLILSSCTQYQEVSKETNKTNQHINVPETKFFIIVPSGFEIEKSSSKVTIIRKRKHARIYFFGNSEKNYHTGLKKFKRDFEEIGVPDSLYKDMNINKYSATYFALESSLGRPTYFIFGDTNFCTLVMVERYSIDNETDDEIEKILQSIYYDKKMKVNKKRKEKPYCPAYE